MVQRVKHKRVLLKLSGEVLMGRQEFGFEKEACAHIAASIRDVLNLGVELAVVVGGGNIFRGREAKAFGFDRTPADHIGMLATFMNGLVLQQALSALGVESQVMSAIQCGLIAESYQWRHAMHALQKHRVVIFVGGTGNPYFTTDAAAALRASELGAGAVLKGTKVAGIYDKDPLAFKDARKKDTMTFSQALAEPLGVIMDAAALALCRDNNIPIYVFNIFAEGSLIEAVCEQKKGTLVTVS